MDVDSIDVFALWFLLAGGVIGREPDGDVSVKRLVPELDKSGRRIKSGGDEDARWGGVRRVWELDLHVVLCGR